MAIWTLGMPGQGEIITVSISFGRGFPKVGVLCSLVLYHWLIMRLASSRRFWRRDDVPARPLAQVHIEVAMNPCPQFQ